LKGIVDIARDVRVDYQHSNSRDKAINYFRKSIYERINSVANYCTPKGIHFEKMLCSLLCLSKNLEGVLFDVIKSRMREKQKDYDKMPLKSIEQIYGAIEANIPDEYKFNKNTTVFVMNCVTNNCSRLELTSDIIDEVNNTHSIGKGMFLYSLITK
jgi:hypothetical protein